MEGALVSRRSEVFEPLHAMVEINSYYKWCMFFLSMIGLWPYTSKKLRILQNSIVSIGTWVFVISQSLAFFTVERNLLHLLRTTSFITIGMGALTKYHIAWYQMNDVKGFLNRVRLHWKTNNKEILQIMGIRAFHGKHLVIIFTAFVYPSACMIMLYHIFPIILDKILPLNESRPVKFPIDLEFFIDKKQHPIINTFLLYLLVMINVTIFVGTESVMIMIVSHITGLFEVASYHFQKAVLSESSGTHLLQDSANNKSISYIANGVIVHRMAFQFARDVNNYCKISYLLAIMFGVIAVSIHLFCLSQTVFRTADITETILSMLLITSILGYMFWMNLLVEYMIQSAGSISHATYNTNWYETSVATQKLLQLIILKSNSGFALNFLSIYVPSVEGFAVLLKASISYFTVLLSLQ